MLPIMVPAGDDVRMVGDRAPVPGALVHPLVLLLGLASLLRVILVVQGGQMYWPDEQRYIAVLRHWDNTGWEVLRAIMSTGDHLGFALVAAPPASLHHALNAWLGLSEDRLLLWPALVLSQMSVLSIALVYAIARRSGAERAEAIMAATLMTCATSMLYYSRHLLPYDSAMAFALGALWCGIGTGGRARFAACGALAACAVITYYGYWLLAAVALLLPLASGLPGWPEARRRAILAALGFAAVLLVVIAMQGALGVPLLFTGMASLAGTVSDGYLREGFTLSWAYLWHAEHGLLWLWLAACAGLLVSDATWLRNRRGVALLWLGGAVAIYVGLATSSALFRIFVVMGRQSRQMVPLLCLAAAPVLVALLARSRAPQVVVALGASALIVQTAYNVREPIVQQFPREFEAQVESIYTPLDYDISIAGPTPLRGDPGSRWVLLNVQHLHPPRTPKQVPSGRTIFQAPHPLEFLPYQYEGFTPIQREVLRTSDIAMRLIDTGPR
jgi:hypothetical protein